MAFLLNSSFVMAQGNFLYDQQSSTDETPYPNGAGPTIQQLVSPYGQSFTPTLSAIDFIRLNLNDRNPNNGLGASLFVNLRTNSIGGPVLSSTATVTLADGFTGVVNFAFLFSVTLSPGTVYYFEPVVQSGDQWNVIAGEYYYPDGTAFYQGLALSGSDYWFREGIVVPEPSSACLILVGGGLLVYARKKRNLT